MSHSLLNSDRALNNLQATKQRSIRLPLVKTTDIIGLCSNIFRTLPDRYSQMATLRVRMQSDIAEITVECTDREDGDAVSFEVGFTDQFTLAFGAHTPGAVSDSHRIHALYDTPTLEFLAVPAKGNTGEVYGANRRWAVITSALKGDERSLRCKYVGSDGSTLTNACNGRYQCMMAHSWRPNTPATHVGDVQVTGDGVIHFEPNAYFRRLADTLNHPEFRIGVNGAGIVSADGAVSFVSMHSAGLSGVVIPT